MNTVKKFNLIACCLFFIHTCFAADEPGLLFKVTGSSTSVTISTVMPNHTYPTAGIKIKSSGYQLSGVGSECTMAKTEYCLFSVSDTAPKTFSISGSGNALEITLCLNGNGPLSCQDYMIETGAGKVANALYVVNSFLTYETHDSDASPLDLPPIALCALDPTSQLITSCDSAFDPSYSFIDYSVESIVINDAGDTAYLSVNAEFYAYQCEVDPSTQLLNNCNQVVLDFFSRFCQTPLYPTGGDSGTYAYFVDSGSFSSKRANAYDASLVACSITDKNLDGAGCVDLGMQLNDQAGGIVFNQLEGQDYVYVANYGESSVTVCQLTSPTTVSVPSCNNIGGAGSVAFIEPIGVAFNPANHLLYVTDDDNGEVYACESSQASTTEFTNCQTAFPGSLGLVWSIIFNPTGTMAYIATDSSTVLQCHVNQTDGVTFDRCIPQSGFLETAGFALGFK